MSWLPLPTALLVVKMKSTRNTKQRVTSLPFCHLVKKQSFIQFSLPNRDRSVPVDFSCKTFNVWLISRPVSRQALFTLHSDEACFSGESVVRQCSWQLSQSTTSDLSAGSSPLCAGAGWRRTSRWQQILFLMFMPKERKTILCMFAWMCMKCGTDIHTPQLPWEVAWFGKSISPGFNLRTSHSGLDQSSFCEELLAAMDVL